MQVRLYYRRSASRPCPHDDDRRARSEVQLQASTPYKIMRQVRIARPQLAPAHHALEALARKLLVR